ncbi:DUF898 family protein [Sphingomonas sp. ID1715]|nr:DUF898 family protein [Sphingomonas sp. ID1715]
MAAPASAFRFTGTWREYLPIALTNLLLTLVTLGVYRFWARARERRYLWSRTEFIDDTLEWTGTGREMFIGFLIVMALLLPALLFLQFGFQALIVRQRFVLAFSTMFLIYGGIFFLTGVARYRALRYRLSHSWWHGIRGGGEPGGWRYGFTYLWKMAAGASAAGMLIPWAMTSLWNQRWRAMSFGPWRFEADTDFSPLMGRWILMLVSPFLLLFAAALLGFMAVGLGAASGASGQTGQVLGVIMVVLMVLGIYIGFAILGVGYWAKFLREAIGHTRLGGLEFSFHARSWDWLKLFLGNVGLVVVTLGIGIAFLGYRNWAFFIRHLEATGTVELDDFTQSQTDASGDAEGLASAFDIGAI